VEENHGGTFAGGEVMQFEAVEFGVASGGAKSVRQRAFGNFILVLTSLRKAFNFRGSCWR